MSGAVERRHDARRTINHEFSSVADFVNEYVVNISRSGLFIKTEAPLPVGTRVTLRFSVIADELELIEGVGEVVRVVEKGSRAVAGMGVVFVELGRISKDLIEHILVRR